MYIRNGHDHMMEVLSYYWEKTASKLSAFDTLSLVDWCHIYLKQLKQFGITDTYLQNGFNNLCNAYSRKIHSQINPIIVNILQQEADYGNSVHEMGDCVLMTNAPTDLI